MEAKEFKVGDVVFLNSGSPQMTINYINEAKAEANVRYWNTDLYKFEDATFLLDTISVVQYSEIL